MALTTTLGEILHPSPSAPPARRPPKGTLLPQELDYVLQYALVRRQVLDGETHDRALEHLALQLAGYDTAGKTPAQLSHMRAVIEQKIDKALDISTALSQLGMGTMAWIGLLYDLAHAVDHEGRPVWKYRAVALKLWGLALGVFSSTPQGQGASILIGLSAEGKEGPKAAVAVQWPHRVVSGGATPALPDEGRDPA